MEDPRRELQERPATASPTPTLDRTTPAQARTEEEKEEPQMIVALDSLPLILILKC